MPGVAGITRGVFAVADSRALGPATQQRHAGARLRVIPAENERSYGRIRLRKALVKQGQRVGQERVRRLMRLNGLRSVYRRPYRVTTDSDHTKPVVDNLLDHPFIRVQWTAHGGEACL